MNERQKLKIAVAALETIADYIGTARRNLPKGYVLDGHMVVQIAANPHTYTEIARKALRDMGGSA